MPAQKRPVLPASSAASAGDSSSPPPSTAEKHQAEDPAKPPQQEEVKNEAVDADADAVEEGDEAQKQQQQQQQDEVKDEAQQVEEDEKEENQQPELPQKRQDDSEGGGGGDGGSDLDLEDGEEDEMTADDDQLIPVRLADIRKEVQCPICLGIIRKTRTVMECLHRFCRECIDKSMRLGNNECPACRTHCASRRSLRDDSNYDFLISAIYADIDKYEEEELAFREEEKSRNKKIQAAIAETFRRQAEALGRKRYTAKTSASAFVRRSQGNYRNSYFRGRGRSYGYEAAVAVSDDDNELEANNDDGGKESSADEPSPERRQKRCKRWSLPRSSPIRVVSSGDAGSVENDNVEVNKETVRTSPICTGEILAWGKNGTRSQTRHGSSLGGSAGRMVKGRMTRLVEHLRNLEQTDQLDVHLVLIPLDEKSNLQQPYVCCRPTMSVKHICEFIALQASVQIEEVQLYANKIQGGTSMDITRSDLLEVQVLEEQETLGSLANSYTNGQGELVLFYNLKM